MYTANSEEVFWFGKASRSKSSPLAAAESGGGENAVAVLPRNLGPSQAETPKAANQKNNTKYLYFWSTLVYTVTKVIRVLGQFLVCSVT
jgi:hypothetical protein